MHEETGMPADDYSQEVRSKEIGGSDAAVILGVHPTRGPMDLWMDKMGMTEKTPMTIPLRFGKFIQPFIGELYAESNLAEGQHLFINDQFDRLCFFGNTPPHHDIGEVPIGLRVTHPEYPFLVGHLDGFVLQEGSKWPDILWPIEGKSYNAHAAGQWGEDDDVPDIVFAQCQHYLAILNMEFIDIPLFIGTDKFEVRRLYRHDGFISAMLEKELAFKKLLDEKKPPEIDSSDASMRYIKSLCPKESVEIIVDEKHGIYPIVAEYKARKDALKEVESEADLWKNRLAEAIVEAGATKIRILSPSINGSVSFSGGNPSTKTAWKEALGAMITAIKAAHPDFDTDSILSRFTEETITPRQFRPTFK